AVCRVPELHLAGHIDGGQALAVILKGDRFQVGVAAGECGIFRMTGDVPDLDDTSRGADGDDTTTVGTEMDDFHRMSVAPEGDSLYPGFQVPDADRAIFAALGQAT